MSDTNTQTPDEVATSPEPEPSVGPPASSRGQEGTGAPEAQEKPPETPRKARTGGVPAGPVALATANTATLAGSATYAAAGLPGLAAAAAVGTAVLVAALASAPGR